MESAHRHPRTTANGFRSRLNEDAGGRQLNRRVEVIVSNNASPVQPARLTLASPHPVGFDAHQAGSGGNMRQYRNAVMDNARWDGFEPRPGDIFVCTPSKCGTTWMQTIVANLLWPDGDMPGALFVRSPWIEATFMMPSADMHRLLGAQTHRRAMKSHTPADGIPWFPDAKYITVGRDGRDAFMSWCNHVSRMKLLDAMQAQAASEGISPPPRSTATTAAISSTGSATTISSTSCRRTGSAAASRTCCSRTTTT